MQTRNKRGGHVRIRRNGKWVYLHRYVYEMVHGPQPSSVKIRHKCDTPDCFRFDHLEAGTQADNMRDMIERGRNRNGKERNHCSQGHEYTEENTYMRKDRPGHRECRICRREAVARYKAGQ